MNHEIKKDDHNCDCKCGFGDIIPKIMKFNLGEIIAFAAIFLLLVISIFRWFSFSSFTEIILPLGVFTFILYLIFMFAEKFTCFESKYLKLINTILLGITTVAYVFFIIKGWKYNFTVESLIWFILILAANAYWAYDLIMVFLAKQKEEAAKREAEKPVEEPKKEEEKLEEKPAEEPVKEEEKPEDKEEEAKEEPEEEEKESDDEEEKKDE